MLINDKDSKMEAKVNKWFRDNPSHRHSYEAMVERKKQIAAKSGPEYEAWLKRNVMNEYEIEVYRDDCWWMIRIPAVDGLTQARRLSEVDYMARDYLALATHTPIERIAVRRI